jgi:hypothetical protein
MSNFTLELGVEVKSKISGFKGMISSRAEHLNGCNRYWVSPKVDKDNKIIDGYWFDEGELEIIKPAKLKRTNSDRGGFPSQIK